MELKVNMVDDVAVVLLPGESIDASNAKEVRRELDTVLEANKKVIFDLKELKFLDSSGLGTFLSCLRKINNIGGELKLINMTKQVKVLFELVRMNKIFEIYEDQVSAIKAFN